MARNVLANAFSLTMLPIEAMDFVRVKKINPNDVPADVEPAIGHQDTAKVVSNILGFEVKPNRVSIKLTENDVLYVAQYTGEYKLKCVKSKEILIMHTFFVQERRKHEYEKNKY